MYTLVFPWMSLNSTEPSPPVVLVSIKEPSSRCNSIVALASAVSLIDSLAFIVRLVVVGNSLRFTIFVPLFSKFSS